jgi:hypothetical protein
LGARRDRRLPAPHGDERSSGNLQPGRTIQRRQPERRVPRRDERAAVRCICRSGASSSRNTSCCGSLAGRPPGGRASVRTWAESAGPALGQLASLPLATPLLDRIDPRGARCQSRSMASLADVFRVLNELEAAGVIERYAVGGAIGDAFLGGARRHVRFGRFRASSRDLLPGSLARATLFRAPRTRLPRGGGARADPRNSGAISTVSQ